jgi:Beta protein
MIQSAMYALPVQQPLFATSVPSPIPAGPLHYVPVLLDRRGERDALTNAGPQVWQRMTPLVQVELRGVAATEPTDSSVRDKIRQLGSALGAHPFYLDVLPNGRRGAGVVARYALRVHRAALADGLRSTPVHALGRNDHAAAVAAMEESGRRGIAMRMPLLATIGVGAESPADRVRRDLDSMKLEPAEVDLVMDMGHLRPDDELAASDLATLIRECGDVGRWRRLILVGSSIPSSLADEVGEDTSDTLPRREYDLWLAVGLPSGVAFGDYGIQGPKPPYDGRGGPGRANLRYTTASGTVAFRGLGAVNSLPKAEADDQYRRMCQSVMLLGSFGGGGCCWGDELIEGCALGDRVPGRQEMWRGAGTAHHLVVVADSLSALEAAATLPALPHVATRLRRSARMPEPIHVGQPTGRAHRAR